MTVAHVLGRFNAAGRGTFHYRPLKSWLSPSTSSALRPMLPERGPWPELIYAMANWR